MRKRPYLTIEMYIEVIKKPYRKEIQPDGRIRYWAKIEEFGGRCRYI